MAMRIVMLLCSIFSSTAIDSCIHDETMGTCQGVPHIPRAGNTMLQTKSESNSEATPNHRDHKHHKNAKVGHREPDELMLSLTSRVESVDAMLTNLEAKSGTGRDTLRAGLDALKEASKGVAADSDAAKARVSAAEGAMSALEDVVNQNNGELRTQVDNVRSQFESLGKKVGQHRGSALEARSEQGDPGGAALVAQVAALEGRCTKLEEESGNGRLALKTELVALEKEIAALQAGGAGSLDFTSERVSSAESQIASLAAAVDEQSADLTAGLAALEKKSQSLGKNVGSLLAAGEDPAGAPPPPPAGSGGGGAVLPLTSRIASLEKRAALLEGKSEDGRGELQIQLDTLTETLSSMKEGGVKSLAHTVVRVGSMEAEIASLTAGVEKQKADITAETEALKATLDSLGARVGA